VCGEIVEDDVNLLPRRAQGDYLLEKGDELAAGVAGGGLAVDAAGGGIERRIQGERAVPVVLEAELENGYDITYELRQCRV